MTGPVRDSADIVQAHFRDVLLVERPAAPEISGRLAGRRLALVPPVQQPQAFVLREMLDGLARCRDQPAVPELQFSEALVQCQASPQSA
ncbi:MAG: hypothetical protein WB780_15730 [Candidatus Acidiferrales bacterium]